ncbi:MAG: KamA family protein [Deltaproteobacteria bacterium]|nr:KamA family protein [Deltaproteobacteria bacterium]
MYEELDKVAISVKSHKLLEQLLKENPKLKMIMLNSKDATEANLGIRSWVLKELQDRPAAMKYYRGEAANHETFLELSWSDYAAIRILDYIDNAGREFVDLNLRGAPVVTNPFKQIWLAVTNGTGGAKPFFFEDMIYLFRQFSGKDKRAIPSRKKVEQWMNRYPSGLDPRIVWLRQKNCNRLLNIIINKIDSGEIKDTTFTFAPGMPREQKFLRALEWWQDSSFHLRFAIRSADLLNEMLDFSLDPDTMAVLRDAEKAGIPFFVNPYYLSLLHVSGPYFAIEADLAIRDYIIYSRQLVEEFGHIVAWEKEDKVEPGKPNAAGWLLPSAHNIHRRYPDVAIFIPDTMGRACGGLCSVCQRMYDFQRGVFNFNFEKLAPNETWPQRLGRLMDYFEKDSQIRDILISGGDALMSSNASLQQILDAVYTMALNKKNANKKRKDGEKYAELLRVRLGTRLPVYLPQRITPELTKTLADFKGKASKIGVKQFVIQTHFASPMEVTPEAREAVKRLLSAGWIVTNQLVFTVAASRRGHTAKLRNVLNDIGVLTYYTFTVKGYRENFHNFTPNARCLQEQMEERVVGKIPLEHYETLKAFPLEAEKIVENIDALRKSANLPFLATDRNVINLPGVGKSLTFRMIGITRYGRRILEFSHDVTRAHSPITEKMGKVVIIESKSIGEYLRQLEDIGEYVVEYKDVYGYSIGETEPRMPLYEYPEYDFRITEEFTNLQCD